LERTSGPLADGASGPAYVGRGSAKDFAVNVVLPFMHACDRWQVLQKGEPEPSPKSPAEEPGALEKLYRNFTLWAANEITQEMVSYCQPVG
jgi:hypothetical protein